jgi:hypothetical protein
VQSLDHFVRRIEEMLMRKCPSQMQTLWVTVKAECFDECLVCARLEIIFGKVEKSPEFWRKCPIRSEIIPEGAKDVLWSFVTMTKNCIRATVVVSDRWVANKIGTRQLKATTSCIARF